MKKTTCRDLRGACDEVITGETPEEIGQKCQKHVKEKIAAGDEGHLEAVQEMQELSPEEQQKWYQEFVERFDQLEEA